MDTKIQFKNILQRAVDGGWEDNHDYRYATIFTHSFAKAFWGEDHYCWWADGIFMDSELTRAQYEEREGKRKEEGAWWDEYMPLWKHMLREMVVLEDPIEFLAQFIGDENDN